MRARLLDAETWRQILTRLATELDGHRRVRMIIVGGVAVALGLNGRRTTADLDAVLPPDDTEKISAAANRIAPEFGLAPELAERECARGRLHSATHRGGHDLDDVWNVTGGFVRVAQQIKAKYHLDVLWELLDEPT